MPWGTFLTYIAQGFIVLIAIFVITAMLSVVVKEFRKK